MKEPAAPAIRHTLCWGGPGAAFELRSSDAALVARAAEIFSTWPAVENVSRQSWDVERVSESLHSGDLAWEVRSSATPDVMRRRTGNHALAAVESAAQDALLNAQTTAVSLHGALLSRDGTTIGVLGASMTGKSTLAFAMWQRGWRLLSDDLFLSDSDTRLAWPSPRRVHLRTTSEPLVGTELIGKLRATPAYDRLGGTHVFRPSDTDGHRQPGRAPLDTVVFLGRTPADPIPAHLTRVEPAHALLAMLPFSLRLSRQGLGYAIRHARAIADHVAAYDLTRGPVEDMMRAIDTIDMRRSA